MRKLIAVLIVALAATGCTTTENGGGDDSPQEESAPRLFPDRADAQEKDIERNVGQEATVGGISATVTTAAFTQQLSEFETAGYLNVDVGLKNTDDSPHPYNTFDWRVQTPEGQVLDPTFSSEGNDLGSGDLVAGGTKQGRVTFEVGSQKGKFYILYKPGFIDDTRGVWETTVA